ncbi:hypothetical protein Pcinc_011783 [Petrolisthes cinctipes]|uniref:Ribonucleoside-diphosphate reductase large subunit n=1 Tax=Petrolisthes cinctipes TaxID=88211 RepID=A0AAE1KU44_PETCI|nr:hypothetical protein Pcinc_011783 [Petrolisthes cinctipes]
MASYSETYTYEGEHGCRHVVKRSGLTEPFISHKIYARIRDACLGLKHINIVKFTDDIIPAIRDGIHTNEIDTYIAATANNKSFQNTEFDTLATEILVLNCHRNIKDPFSVIMDRMCGKGIVDPKMNEYVQENADFLERALRHDKDKEFSFFGLRSLFDKYLLKDRNGIMVERPQHMLMREAIAVNQYSEDPEKRRNAVLKTYEMLSERRYTHAHTIQRLHHHPSAL